MGSAQSAEAQLRKNAKRATSYEEWKLCQKGLEEVQGVNAWLLSPESPEYGWLALINFKDGLSTNRTRSNLRALCSQLRIQASRNICNVTNPSLYGRSLIHTKKLIHEYLREVRKAIHHVIGDERPSDPSFVISAQEKAELIRDVRTHLGRSTLVLQSGAMVSMCHLGVVKALHSRGLLPSVITGTGTGALIAALATTVPDERLLGRLDTESIDLSAFEGAQRRNDHAGGQWWFLSAWSRSVLRRLGRFWQTGHFFDIGVIEQCARDNIGDLTFDEAYASSGRVLNINIAIPIVQGTPQLLNHVTAPHVLIWSAVAASVATSRRLYAPAALLYKDDTGAIARYFAPDSYRTKGDQTSSVHPEAPLERIGELFNVNHYIFSQTRPYVIPFLKLQETASRWHWLLGRLVTVFLYEVLFWIKELGQIGLLPVFIQRVLVDEVSPSSAQHCKLTIVPELELADYMAIFDTPNAASIDRWARIGERSVWPFVCQLKMRCGVEFELEALTGDSDE